MEFIRRHIETRVLSLTGLAIGGVDYENPPGDPGLFGPESVCWRVHGDFTSMMVGGISALLLQALHPLALSGVWDHSNFREDLLGRLRRTGQFISATTFGSHADADRLIERVKRIHAGVSGTAPDGRPYAASDPDLLTWVHVAEVSSFLKSHLRYLNPDLPPAEQDRYYAEVALIAERLGAGDVPRSRAQIEAYLERTSPQLRSDERALEILQILRTAPAPSPPAQALRNADAARWCRALTRMGSGNAWPDTERKPTPADPHRGSQHRAGSALGRTQRLGTPRASAHGPAATLAPGNQRSDS